jgi:hypothetical protein
MPRMMAHPRQSLDDRRHARQRPEVCAESVPARTRAQRLCDRRQLLGPKLGLSPGAPGGFEPRAPVRVPGVIPVVSGHRRDPQGPRHAPCDSPCANNRAAWNRRASNAAKSRREPAGVAMPQHAMVPVKSFSLFCEIH